MSNYSEFVKVRKLKYDIPCDIPYFALTPFYSSIVIHCEQLQETLAITQNELRIYFEKWLPYYHYTLVAESFTEYELTSELVNLWNEYTKNNGNNWSRWLYALLSDYSPIENVDAKEERTTTYSGSEKDTLTFTGTETNTTTPDGVSMTTATNMSSPNTDDNWYPQEQTVTESAFNNYKTESTNSFDDRKNESTHTFTNRQDKEVYTRHGNIGVTKSSELMVDELNARKFDFVEMIVLNFLNKYFSIGVD